MMYTDILSQLVEGILKLGRGAPTTTLELDPHFPKKSFTHNHEPKQHPGAQAGHEPLHRAQRVPPPHVIMNVWSAVKMTRTSHVAVQ